MSLHQKPNKATLISILLIASCVMGASYWVVSLISFPDQDLYTALLFRKGGDYGYELLIKSLSNFSLSETFTLGGESSGRHPFPALAIAPHAIGFAVFGPAGYIILDILLTAITSILLFLIFRRTSNSAFIAAIVALLALAMYFYPPGLNKLMGAISIRYPRPLVSNLYVFGTVLLLLDFYMDPSRFMRSKSIWLLGVVLAMCATIDPYSSLTLGAFLLVLLGKNIITTPAKKMQHLAALVKISVTAIPILGITIWQHAQVSGDAVRRIGISEMSNRLGVLESYILYPWLWIVLCLIFINIFLSKLLIKKTHSVGLATDTKTQAAIVLALLGVISTIVPVLFFLISPKAVQLYHFKFPVLIFIFLHGFFNVSILLDLISIKSGGYYLITERLRHKYTGIIAFAGFALAMVGLVFISMDRYVNFKSTYREYPQRANSLPKVFSIIETLANHKNINTIITNDQLVNLWWYLKHNGTTLLPDSFATTLSDKEFETRFICKAHLLNIPQEEFSEWLTHHSSMFHMKYTAYIASIPFDRSWYTKEQLAHISATSWTTSSNQVIPQREIVRLTQRYKTYNATTTSICNVDLLVINKNEKYKPANHAPRGFCKNYENSHFEIWNHTPCTPELSKQIRK